MGRKKSSKVGNPPALDQLIAATKMALETALRSKIPVDVSKLSSIVATECYKQFEGGQSYFPVLHCWDQSSLYVRAYTLKQQGKTYREIGEIIGRRSNVTIMQYVRWGRELDFKSRQSQLFPDQAN